METGLVRLVDGEARIESHLKSPGFLHLKAIAKGVDGVAPLEAAAGVDPTQIAPSMPEPRDFDAFWSSQLGQLAGVPATAKMSSVTSGNPAVDAYDVRVSALGAPVSGYLANPRGATPGSLPAIITLHGAGVRSARLDIAVNWAAHGLLALDINAHGISNGQPDSYYTELANGPLFNYRLRGRESRETFYFREMFLRVVRAIDFITSLPEWDGRTLILRGNSQGGAQALAGAGLDQRVTMVVATVPAMADLTGSVMDRAMGWPRMSELYHPEEQVPDVAGRIIETLRYYDVGNFAARIRAEAFLTVGFIDASCPPSTVYAAYNRIPTKKAIYNDVLAGHVNTPEASQRAEQAVLDHVAEMRG